MGTAITTIAYTGGTITLQINETTPSESDSPPPRMVNVVRKRAIAKHRIPSREGDRGQDMGSYSPTVQVQGLALAAEKAKFDTLAGTAQLDVDGHGIVTVTEKGATGATLESVDRLALEDYSVAVVPGRPSGKWFNYIANFTRFD